MKLRLSGVNYARCKPLHRRGSRGNDRPRGRAIALSVVNAAGALLLIMPPVIGVTGTLSLLTALIAAFGVGWGIHTRTIGFIAHPRRRRAGPFYCQRPAGCWRW